jgi:hypothetical protein
MKILQPPFRRDVMYIVLAALVLRLVALPWAQTVHADAVSRIHIAYEWMLDPHYITDGDWGPLHHYLNALFMLIFPGKVLGPNVLNILCGSLTAIPLYGIALNLFNSRPGAIFAALLYVFSPIVIWTGLQPLSEVPFAFFLAFAMFFLSEGVNDGKGMRNAVLGGLFMTLAAAIRYEAWVLIAVFTLILLLHRSWRQTIVFWACAMLFPASWMLGNLVEHGDALYSISRNDSWYLMMEGVNDEISTEDRIKRLVFFPWSLMLNISPIVLVLLLVALGRDTVRRSMDRSRWLWLLPFAVMVLVFQQKAWTGSLSLHHRFVITWLVLLLPFVPLVFIGRSRPVLHLSLMSLAAITLIPLAFFWNLVDHTRAFGDNAFGRAMDQLVLAHYREMQVIPRIPGDETEQLLSSINAWGRPGEGLVLDFHGWDRSYYIALHALPHTMIIGGAKHQEFKAEELREFLEEHLHGQLVFSRTGMLNAHALRQGDILGFEGVDMALAISEVEEFRGLRRMNYNVLPPGQEVTFAMDEGARIFPESPDAEFFDARIRSDEAWFSMVRRKAFWKGMPLENEIRNNVDYMLSLENVD